MSKSIIFLVQSFLGNFYRHLAIFSDHTDVEWKWWEKETLITSTENLAFLSLWPKCSEVLLLLPLHKLNEREKLILTNLAFDETQNSILPLKSIKIHFNFLNGPFPNSLYFSPLFCIQLTTNNCSIKVADDSIRTWVLWFGKPAKCAQTTALSIFSPGGQCL